MRLKLLPLALLLAGLSASVASAYPGPPRGHDRPVGDRPGSVDAEAGESSAPSEGEPYKPVERRAECRPRAWILLKGTLLSVGEGSFTMRVERANRLGRLLVGSDVTLLVLERTRIQREGEGSVTLASLAADEALKVLAVPCKARDGSGGTVEPRLVAKLVLVGTPGEVETPEATTG